MTTCLLRLWLPDKPGSLGHVATALGEAGANLIGIEIIESQGGVVIDELAIETEYPSVAINALRRIEGVSVESCHPIGSDTEYDPRLDALDVASKFAVARFRAEGNGVMMHAVVRLLLPDWAVLFARPDHRYVRAYGEVPAVPWLEAVLAGLDHGVAADLGAPEDRASGFGPADLAYASIGPDLCVVLGRSERPFGRRERRLLLSLAKLHAAQRIERASSPTRASA
jgi:hypothetical protein